MTRYFSSRGGGLKPLCIAAELQAAFDFSFLPFPLFTLKYYFCLPLPPLAKEHPSNKNERANDSIRFLQEIAVEEGEYCNGH